jgi:ethanolamine ammonia-lyase large subunit
MKLKANLLGVTYSFKDVKDVLAKANEFKSGDDFAGIGAVSNKERIAAKIVLAELTLEDLRYNPVIPFEKDEVTRVIDGLVNEKIFAEIKSWTVGYLREWVLSHKTSGEDIKRVSRGLTAEMIAGVAKLMTNMDLVYGARKIRVITRAHTELGHNGTLSFRNQPNHPNDNIEGIMASLAEGLSYGSGDAMIGVNPNDDGVDNIKKIMQVVHDAIIKWEIPTQSCVLAHITTQMEAIKDDAPVSVLFQSLAGSQTANEAFGINAQMIGEGYDLIQKYGTAAGPQLMYFETGQGAEMTLAAHHGADMVTLEARCYGFAKKYDPFMVNNVSGFIGPETLYNGREIIRASLEDHFMGKLTGLPMGMAPCYTNHVDSDQNDQENATMLLAMAGANFYMGVPHGDDVMLSYQDTSFHDDATLREILGLKPAPEFFQWLIKRGIMDESGILTERAGDASIFVK